jgi:hypothetical protein
MLNAVGDPRCRDSVNGRRRTVARLLDDSGVGELLSIRQTERVRIVNPQPNAPIASTLDAMAA